MIYLRDMRVIRYATEYRTSKRVTVIDRKLDIPIQPVGILPTRPMLVLFETPTSNVHLYYLTFSAEANCAELMLRARDEGVE